MRRASHIAVAVLLVSCSALTLRVQALAEVAPGEVIDATNWQKAEGLLPESVLNWVKKGDFVIRLAKLNFDPRDYFPEFQIKAFESNVGKYELDEEDGIIEVKTGKRPKHLVGLPFPKIDPDDPKLAVKALYNNHYMQYLPDNLRFPYQGIFMSRAGYERETDALWYQMAMDGNPLAVKRPNTHGFEKFAITVIKKPYDVAGTAVMTWRYVDPNKQDNSFGYVPAIRRVRRMSPANRSDAFMGSDFSVDDANGYDGKVTAFTWKLLRKQEAIVPFLSSEPVRIVRNEADEWETTEGIKAVIFGYQKKGEWKGVSWAPTNLAWVKRPVYVIEMTPKDPYYNYGVQHLWVDAGNYGVYYKVINDKSGSYWKTFFTSTMVCESADKTMRFTSLATQQVIDDRADHSTIIEDASPRNIWAYYAQMDLYDFTLGGFQKFCK